MGELEVTKNEISHARGYAVRRMRDREADDTTKLSDLFEFENLPYDPKLVKLTKKDRFKIAIWFFIQGVRG